ncbi:hypothetical protein Misp06_02539 [Microbulbifer sp. NBRC 101763]|uniref:hypothetical protein n=1 Tax=Microbulbifer sp. NBRC 101763 TaxID=1113820 RepID=UPI00309DB62B
MTRKIIIIKIETEEIITTDQISLGGLNYDPQDQEWFDQAWDNAISDGLVNSNDRSKYKIVFA